MSTGETLQMLAVFACLAYVPVWMALYPMDVRARRRWRESARRVIWRVRVAGVAERVGRVLRRQR